MSHERRTTLLEEILALTVAAKDAARIEHDRVLLPTLRKRERKIAALLGFDPEKPLPPFSGKGGTTATAIAENGDGKAILKEIRVSQGLLEQALEVRMRRLRGEENLLHQGERYFRDMREFVGLKRGKLLDRQG